MVGTTIFETAQPSLIPGYTGYLPQYIYRVGDSFGLASHKILLDPNINLADRLVLSNREVDDSTVHRPNDNDIDIVEKRTKYGEVILRHPVIPGYEGTIPGIRGKFGQRFSAEATVALSEFEKAQQKQREYRKKLQHYKTLQCDEGEPRDLLDKLVLSEMQNLDVKRHKPFPMPYSNPHNNSLGDAWLQFAFWTKSHKVQKNKAKLPLCLVRPEAAGIVRLISVPEGSATKFDNTVSPYFLDPGHEEKYFKLGYAGHIPFGNAHFGESQKCISTASLVDFTNNYRRRLSSEWAPVTASAPDPPDALMPPEIYHKHVGMLPHYMGHLPGAQFRYGKTIGNDTKDAKRWLRGDFSG